MVVPVTVAVNRAAPPVVSEAEIGEIETVTCGGGGGGGVTVTVAVAETLLDAAAVAVTVKVPAEDGAV